MKAISRIEGIFYAAIYVNLNYVRRIVSARCANRREIKQWLESE